MVAIAATTYNGNTRTGFGGPVGAGSLDFSDDGTNLTVSFTRGSGLTFNTDFDSDFAFALKANSSVSNHMFTTPSGADANSLVFVNTYTVSNFGSNNAAATAG